jgi:hypothetical protein
MARKLFSVTGIVSPYGKSADSVSTFVFKEFSYGEKSPGRAKDFCLHKGCQKMSKFGDSFEKCSGHF